MITGRRKGEKKKKTSVELRFQYLKKGKRTHTQKNLTSILPWRLKTCEVMNKLGMFKIMSDSVNNIFQILK